MMNRLTVAVDFDGVIHSHSKPMDPTFRAWNIEGPPVDGALEWLASLQEQFHVIILTARLSARKYSPREIFKIQKAMAEWFEEWGYDSTLTDRLHFWTFQGKPEAVVYIDDRGYRFTGYNFPSNDEIMNAVPWHKAELWEE